MKTRNVLKLMAILIAVVGINIAGCKKDKTSTTPDPSSLQQLSKDDAQVQATDDQITGDANSVLSSSSSKSMDTTISSCVITVDTVHGDTLQITLLYNGFSMGSGFKRTGTVVITKLLTSHWSDMGCAVTFKYESLSVEKISSGKTFIFNGTRTWTNVSGGLIKNLNGSTTVTHQITGAMTITFEDGSTRVWTISRQRVWGGTYPAALTVTVSGFGSAAGYNNLVEYGTNRKGEAFYTQINTPILYAFNSCLAFQWIPIWGVIEYQIPSVPKSATLTFGYNSSETLVPYGNCADYFRLDWVVKTNSGTDYFQIP
jgi:hypothetical protein